MTTETVLVSTDWDPESPITTNVAGAWSQNWIAGFEGNSTNKVAFGALSISGVSAGSVEAFSTPLDDVQQTTSTSYLTVSGGGFHDTKTDSFSVRVFCSGTITCSGLHSTAGSAQTSSFRVLKNGALVQEWNITGTTTYQSRTVDVSVSVGDVITFQQKCTGGVASRWVNLKIKGDEIFPVSLVAWGV